MDGISIAAHPRAAQSVRRSRGIAGLAGFLLGAWLAHRATLPAFDVVLRALIAGLGAHCAVWFLAVTYWRAAILTELEQARERREARTREAADEVMRAAAETAAA